MNLKNFKGLSLSQKISLVVLLLLLISLPLVAIAAFNPVKLFKKAGEKTEPTCVLRPRQCLANEFPQDQCMMPKTGYISVWCCSGLGPNPTTPTPPIPMLTPTPTLFTPTPVPTTVFSPTKAVSMPKITRSVFPSQVYPNGNFVIRGEKFGWEKGKICFSIVFGSFRSSCEGIFTIDFWSDTQINARVVDNPAFAGEGYLGLITGQNNPSNKVYFKISISPTPTLAPLPTSTPLPPR